MNILTALEGVHLLGFDTAPVIYFVESHPVYDARVTTVFQRIGDGRLSGVASVITLTEVLTKPMMVGDVGLQKEYRELLQNSRNLRLLPIGVVLAEQAAGLRARYNLRTPDALQIAAAISAGCQAFLTNDANHKRVKEIRVLVLDELTE